VLIDRLMKRSSVALLTGLMQVDAVYEWEVPQMRQSINAANRVHVSLGRLRQGF
jgi:hypothetical protein